MKILVTGAAGFIGYSVIQRLLARGDTVIGVDCVNDYYDVRLKEARLFKLREAGATGSPSCGRTSPTVAGGHTGNPLDYLPK
jgi:UDP-glucuronate 4-epimerase